MGDDLDLGIVEGAQCCNLEAVGSCHVTNEKKEEEKNSQDT